MLNGMVPSVSAMLSSYIHVDHHHPARRFPPILLGGVFLRRSAWGLDFWNGLEKLVYFILLPALLSNAPIDFGHTGTLLETALQTCSVGTALG